MRNFTKNYFLFLFFVIIFLIFFNNIKLSAQNIIIGFGSGLSTIYAKDSLNIDMLDYLYEPAICYEIFSYLSLPIFNKLDFLLGFSLISKGFLYSENQKHELVYLHLIMRLRYLFFRNVNSSAFIEFGFNVFGQLLKDFILNYSNFSISYNNDVQIRTDDQSINLGTGIIYKNLIFSFNIQIQINEVFNIYNEVEQYDMNFGNYSMVFSFGFII